MNKMDYVELMALDMIVGQMQDYVDDDYIADVGGENSKALQILRRYLDLTGIKFRDGEWREFMKIDSNAVGTRLTHRAVGA